MKRGILMFVLGVAVAVCASAQEIVTIQGTDFYVELNYANRTAVISNYDYVPEHAKFPMNTQRRNIKKIDANKRQLTIPETVDVMGREYTVTGIGYAAFADFQNIDFVSMPSTVTMIGDYAFFRSSVKDVKISESVESIGDYAFAHTKVKDVVVPVSVMSIGEGAFDNCAKLTRLCLPDKVISEVNPFNVAKSFRKTRNYDEGAKTMVQNEDASAPAIKQEAKPKVKVTSSDVEMNIPYAVGSAENTFAFIIANENYHNTPDVDYALQDGRTFREYCSVALGIPDENIRMYENATYNNMRSAIEKMKSISSVYGSDAKMILYYSGHGIPDENGNSFLLPVDGDASDATSGYGLSNLYATLGALESNGVIVFLDACFTGSQRDENFIVEGTKGLRSAREVAPVGNMVVFAASRGDETAHAYPDKGHSLFTYFLLKKLKENRGDVTLGELSDYITDNVRKKALTVLDTKQTPTTLISTTMEKTWRNTPLR